MAWLVATVGASPSPLPCGFKGLVCSWIKWQVVPVPDGSREERVGISIDAGVRNCEARVVTSGLRCFVFRGEMSAPWDVNQAIPDFVHHEYSVVKAAMLPVQRGPT